jgi:hypothetical protein
MSFWVVTPCRLVGRYQYVGETYFFASTALKMETVCFSEILVSAYESTQRFNPEQHRHPYRCENLKSQIHFKALLQNLFLGIVVGHLRHLLRLLSGAMCIFYPTGALLRALTTLQEPVSI